MSKIRFLIYFSTASLCWGGSFYAIHHAIQGLSVSFAVFLRIVVAVLSVGGYLLFSKQLRLTWNHLVFKTMVVGALGMTVPWMFLFWGEQFIQPALAGIITSSVPILVLFLSVIANPKEKILINKWIGIALGFNGIVIIFYPQITFAANDQVILGLLAIAIMAFSYALNVLGTRKMGQHFKEELNLFYQALGALALVIPVLALSPQPWLKPDFAWTHILAVVYLGSMSSAVALFFLFRIIHSVGALEGSAITFFVPVVAIILDALLLNQWIEWWQALGAILILCGLFFVNRKKKDPIQYK